MTAALAQHDVRSDAQPHADRFSIFIDALIESPRFNFSAFCKAARLTASEAIAWLRRPEIVESLNSCVDVIHAAARIRHAVLDTNAMGALGELLRTCDNQIEVRRAATTIISRHRADLRASRSATSQTTEGHEPDRVSHSIPVIPSVQAPPAPLKPQVAARPTAARPSRVAPVDPILQASLLADAFRIDKEPPALQPRTASTLSSRAGALPRSAPSSSLLNLLRSPRDRP